MPQQLTWLLAQTTQNSGLVLRPGAEGGFIECANADVDASPAEGTCDDTVAIADTKGCGGVIECDPGFELIPLFGVGVCNCGCCCCRGSVRANRGSRVRLGSMPVPVLCVIKMRSESN
jgi:hypothetical protein